MRSLYTNELKSWLFGKAGAKSLNQRSGAEAAQPETVERRCPQRRIVVGVGCRRVQNLGCRLCQKANFSVRLCIFCLLVFGFLKPISPLFGIASGNMGAPALFNAGLLTSGQQWWGLRLGYMGDWVYDQAYRAEFDIGDCKTNPTSVKMYTNAGIVTWSIVDRIDIYALLGATRMQIDEEAFSKTRFGWGFGTKFVLLKLGSFLIGVDGKYYESHQKPLYFICEHLAYNLVSPYTLKYTELQGSMGIAFDFGIFSPYANATYIFSKIAPEPSIALVRAPMMDLSIDIQSTSVVSTDRWGFAIGTTLVDTKKASLSIEWRALNQNSLDLTGEVRF